MLAKSYNYMINLGKIYLNNSLLLVNILITLSGYLQSPVITNFSSVPRRTFYSDIHMIIGYCFCMGSTYKALIHFF